MARSGGAHRGDCWCHFCMVCCCSVTRVVESVGIDLGVELSTWSRVLAEMFSPKEVVCGCFCWRDDRRADIYGNTDQVMSCFNIM